MEEQQAFETGRFLGSIIVYILIGLVIFLILKAIFKFINNKKEDDQIIKQASEIFDNDKSSVKTKKNLFSNIHSRSFIIILGIVFIFAAFYWFQIRPAQIKHDCSWVRVLEEAVPAQPAMSVNELLEKGMISDCSQLPDSPTGKGLLLIGRYKQSCELRNQSVINKYRDEKPAVPAKEWWREASPKEYTFCLHNKGL
jgi:hypothetical protein